MNLKDIARFRLFSQQVESSKFKTAKDLVAWMGAMQAQDYAMSKWAIGVRLPGATESTVEAAIQKGEIIRTHLLRPTWHYVSSNDVHWILDLTAPHILASMKSRHRELEISESIISRSNKIIERELAGGKHLTKEELVTALNKGKIATDIHRTIHLFLCAELNKIVCSGKIKDKKQTYALLSERVPKAKTLRRDEALAMLAKRYFTSHGPATVQDFGWWSGLPAKDARNGLEMIRKDFISETIGSQTFWFTNSFSFPKSNSSSVHLLPAYDEFTISYKDRSASLHPDSNKRIISVNGIFQPLIVVNGQIEGSWKRSFKKENVSIETTLFNALSKTAHKGIASAAKQYARFVMKSLA